MQVGRVVQVKRKYWYCIGLLIVVLVAACKAEQSIQVTPSQPLLSDSFSLHIAQQPTPTPTFTIPKQITLLSPTPTPTPKAHPTQTLPAGPPPPTNIAGTGSGPAPYGSPPPMTAEEVQLTQQLFALINHDRAIRGLYPFTWNNTLAGGARLHSWNMVHCGFSHTCPDGLPQCTRIANEGFTFTDCGECIGLAGPYPTPWGGVDAVQESMINEPPTGWHRIHLTSTTLHSVGVGLYVDSRGWIWFTEDMVS
jgi:uncharacterized protein YkwD